MEPQKPVAASDSNNKPNEPTIPVYPDPDAKKVPEQPLDVYSHSQQNIQLTDSSGYKDKLVNALSGSRAYLVEYALLLIITGALLGVVNTLFASSLDYISSPKPQPRFGGFAYTSSLAMLASALVFMPALLLLTKRTKGSEQQSLGLKSINWRKAFLGIFLIVIGLTAITQSIVLVYEVISRIAGAGLPGIKTDAVWKEILKPLFAATLFGFTVWLYSRDYRSSELDDRHETLNRLHRYGLIILALILGILFCFTTLKVQRNTFIDNAIENDIKTIQQKVDSYYYKKSKLPGSLSDIALAEEVKNRTKAYGYKYSKVSSKSYKLCAKFKTDTTKESANGSNALEAYLDKSYSNSYGASESKKSDPAIHKTGEECFSYSLGNYSSPRIPEDDTPYGDDYDSPDYEI